MANSLMMRCEELIKITDSKLEELEAIIDALNWLVSPPCDLDDDPWLFAVETQLGRFALSRQLASQYIIDLEKMRWLAREIGAAHVRLSQIDDRYEELLTYVGGAAQEIERKFYD